MNRGVKIAYLCSHLQNNARAYAKGQDPGASLLNEEGVAIMERAFADDNDEDLQSLLTSML